jgi:Concanavalin A-like lectin/glucanases superfamily/Bacterial Ig domain
VQFKLDGATLGSADMTAPYEYSWDTRGASNGSHTLTAVGVDAAGNQKTSTAVTVTVNNPTGSTGLIAAYGFEELTGTTTGDQTGLGHTGTISGATRSTSGKFGRALSFDGVNDWVTVADKDDLGLTTGMTLEAWAYPTTMNNAWRTVLLKEQAGALAYSLYSSSPGGGRPYAVIFTAGEQLAQGTAKLGANAWTHLTATYDGSALRLYVSGSLAATTLTTGSIAAGSGPLRFGGNSIWSEWFKGRLDEIRVYNRALSQAEIQADMNRAVG